MNDSLYALTWMAARYEGNCVLVGDYGSCLLAYRALNVCVGAPGFRLSNFKMVGLQTGREVDLEHAL